MLSLFLAFALCPLLVAMFAFVRLLMLAAAAGGLLCSPALPPSLTHLRVVQPQCLVWSLAYFMVQPYLALLPTLVALRVGG